MVGWGGIWWGEDRLNKERLSKARFCCERFGDKMLCVFFYQLQVQDTVEKRAMCPKSCLKCHVKEGVWFQASCIQRELAFMNCHLPRLKCHMSCGISTCKMYCTVQCTLYILHWPIWPCKNAQLIVQCTYSCIKSHVSLICPLCRSAA